MEDDSLNKVKKSDVFNMADLVCTKNLLDNERVFRSVNAELIKKLKKKIKFLQKINDDLQEYKDAYEELCKELEYREKENKILRQHIDELEIKIKDIEDNICNSHKI